MIRIQHKAVVTEIATKCVNWLATGYETNSEPELGRDVLKLGAAARPG